MHSTRLLHAATPRPGYGTTVIEGVNIRTRAYQLCLEQSGIIARMSRTGNCWDNSVMESFFGTLKDECVGSTVYSSHNEARLALFTSMEVYYNRIRRHSTLGYVIPLIYEQIEI
jgi:putative transposase